MKKSSAFRAIFSTVLLLTVACSDHGLEPIHEGISGRITFTGAWPDTTEWVRLAVFKKLPATVFDIPINPPLFSDTLPRFVSSYDYEMTVPAGKYEWVVLAWKPIKKNATNDFSGLDTLAMYAQPGTTRVPLAVEVPSKRLLTGIDIIADFAVLSPPSPILP
jgi:hypothetical protein